MLWLNSLSCPLLQLFPYPPLKLFLPTLCMSSFNHQVQLVLRICVVGIKPLAITQLHPRRKLTLLPWQPAAANSSSARSGVWRAPPQSMLDFFAGLIYCRFCTCGHSQYNVCNGTIMLRKECFATVLSNLWLFQLHLPAPSFPLIPMKGGCMQQLNQLWDSY